jgi:glycosyltransferase involved in cell wall biosynthesis
MRMGVIPKRPIITNVVWLMSRWAKLTWPRRKVYQVLSREVSVLTVHSKECLPIVRRAFPRLRSELMFFGINTEYFRLKSPRESDSSILHIVSAGSDRTRDWDTLLAAFGNDARFRLSIACPWLSRRVVAKYPNVTLINSASASDLREIYEAADIIAIPMVTNIYSGITVALEAAAMGRPVLSSYTGGVPTYFDDDQIIYSQPGDPTALRQALLQKTAKQRQEIASRAQQRFLENDYSTCGMIDRYTRLTKEVFRSAEAPRPDLSAPHG